MVDEAIDHCSAIGNLRDDIAECRDSADAPSDAAASNSAAWGARQLGVHYLRRYFLLISFRCWLEGFHLVPPVGRPALSRNGSFNVRGASAAGGRDGSGGGARGDSLLGSPLRDLAPAQLGSSLPTDLSPLSRRLMADSACDSPRGGRFVGFAVGSADGSNDGSHGSLSALAGAGGSGGDLKRMLIKRRSFGDLSRMPSRPSIGELSGIGGGSVPDVGFTQWVKERRELGHLLAHLTLDT